MKRHIPIVAGLAVAIGAAAADFPICEEFAGESNISCVSAGNLAVITSMTEGGRTYEFFNGRKKAYMEVSADGSILASSGTRTLSLPEIPADSSEAYITEVLYGILDDISWK